MGGCQEGHIRAGGEEQRLVLAGEAGLLVTGGQGSGGAEEGGPEIGGEEEKTGPSL